MELSKLINNAERTFRNIYAIGDIVPGPPLAHKASYEGKIAAEAIAGQTSEVDYLAIPAVCFTEPELATVGYMNNRQKMKDLKYAAQDSHLQQMAVHLRLIALMVSSSLSHAKKMDFSLEHKLQVKVHPI